MRHPIASMLDDVAAGGRPPATEIDEVIADLSHWGAPAIPAATLKRRLAEVVDKIVEARDAGCSGEARNIAREHGRDLADELGEYRPPDPNAGKTVEEIVAGIPRAGQW